MTIHLSLSPEAEACLARRAAEAGEDLSSYVSKLVNHFAGPAVSLEELSRPIQERFLETGMTDNELGEMLERTKHEMRAERRRSEST